MNDELRVLEGAEKTLNERGYTWFSYGERDCGSLCLGGAIGAHVTFTNPVLDTTKHPACARMVRILVRGDNVSPDRDKIRDVSFATRKLPEEQVRAALSQAISECRAEMVVNEIDKMQEVHA